MILVFCFFSPKTHDPISLTRLVSVTASLELFTGGQKDHFPVRHNLWVMNLEQLQMFVQGLVSCQPDTIEGTSIEKVFSPDWSDWKLVRCLIVNIGGLSSLWVVLPPGKVVLGRVKKQTGQAKPWGESSWISRVSPFPSSSLPDCKTDTAS